jgi:hypothetical protein
MAGYLVSELTQPDPARMADLIVDATVPERVCVAVLLKAVFPVAFPKTDEAPRLAGPRLKLIGFATVVWNLGVSAVLSPKCFGFTEEWSQSPGSKDYFQSPSRSRW